MKNSQYNHDETNDLNSKAVKLTKPVDLVVDELSHADICKLAHELQVHEIELEMRNEDLRKSQHELEDSRDKYSNLYNFAPVGYVTLSGKGFILNVNLTSTTMLGIERSSLINGCLSQFIASDEKGIYYSFCNRILKIDGHEVCELKMVKSDGSEFYAQLEGVAEKSKGENVKEIRVVITDITVRKLAELEIKSLNVSLEQRVVDRTTELVKSNEALRKEITAHKKSEELLRESEKRFRAIFEQAAVGVAQMVSKTRKFARINKKYCDIVGFTQDEMNQNSFEGITHSDDLQATLDNIQKLEEGEISNFTLEKRYYHKNGSIVWVNLTVSPMRRPGEEPDYRIAIVEDITKRKKMEEALIQSEKLKSIGFMTAGISHEFNNILGIISGHVQLLQMYDTDNSRLDKGLNIIRNAVDNGANITNNMVEFSRPKKDTSAFVCSDMKEIINQALENTMPRWKSMALNAGVNYNVNKEGLEWDQYILCNPAEIRDVFINIIQNALDAMPEGGTISLSTRSDGGTVYVSVTDTGMGMTTGVMRNIFDPFFTTRCPEGTGLGLSTSYSRIAGHNGKINVTSEVGEGSTFTLQFPTAAETVSPEVITEPGQCVATRVLHILIVDDEEDIRMIQAKYLSMQGHKVKAVDNGAEAIELTKNEDFDIVLSDLSMLTTSGYDVVRALNKLDRTPKIGIITGWMGTFKFGKERDLKVDFVLKKPFKFPVLTKHINELFDADSK